MTAAVQTPVPMGYRPALDGLRGVAIAMVVLEHVTGDLPVRLGPTGVTLFFALSGYLITGILLDEHASSGTVRLGRFYLRRAARLLPALLLAVAVCNTLFLLVGDLASIKASFWALLYVANYAVALQGEYPPGWGQTWSLAVEEHFYLVWPLLLLALLRRSRAARALLLVTLVLALASMVWRLSLLVQPIPGVDRLIVFHGSLARADALLYGCAGAIAVRRGVRVPAVAAWPAAAAVLGSAVVFDSSAWFITVGQALASVAAAVLVLAVDGGDGADGVGGVARRGLSWRPLVAVGVVSYGLYLWHYPLLYLAFDVGLGDSLPARAAAGALVAGAASWASYRWLERPVRAWTRANEDRLLRRWSRHRP